MNQVSSSTKLMQAAIVILIAGGALFWLVAEAGRPPGRKDLKVEVGDLRSYVSEGRQIIEQSAAGRLTATYFQTETAMLRDKLADVTKSLGSTKPEPALEGKFAQAKALAESATGELGKLSSSFGNQSALQEAKAKLAEIFGQAEALEKGLTQ